MSEVTTVNAQVTSTLETLKNTTLSGDIIKLSGAGKAYQSVSQSSAIAVQDATDNLRNVNTMATTAMGVAISQMLATGEVDKYKSIIDAANSMVSNSTNNFTAIGNGASQLLGQFPTGE
ncbi:hypothetical protein [Shewanella waksmanii]|uniref:hypothetical protein n=1 Tax=Shewanella waksmanii TaxID=213783 RepID=UPI00048DFE08|nr:hypothetical protein [Shewanella waksmanii]